MNAHDRANLEFLLHTSPDIISDWFNQASEDDITYASELLYAYEQELSGNSGELDVIDLSDANTVINRIMYGA